MRANRTWPGVDVVITDSQGGTQTVTTDANGDYSATVPAGSTTADVDESTLPVGVDVQTAGVDSSTVIVPAGSNTDIGIDGYQPRNPELSIDKVYNGISIDTDGSGDVSVGDTLSYTITATNTGNVDLNGVVVSDDLTGDFTGDGTNPACADPLTLTATCVLDTTYVVTTAERDGRCDQQHRYRRLRSDGAGRRRPNRSMYRLRRIRR